jgi:hypothetical protein
MSWANGGEAGGGWDDGGINGCGGGSGGGGVPYCLSAKDAEAESMVEVGNSLWRRVCGGAARICSGFVAEETTTAVRDRRGGSGGGGRGSGRAPTGSAANRL